MYDALLILPPAGLAYDYMLPENELTPDRLVWKRRLTRIPQGLLSLATFLHQNGFSVKVFDCRFHMMRGQDFIKDFTDAVKQTRLFAGITVYTAHIEVSLQFNKLIKSVCPDLPVVWGGVHPTLYPAQTAQEGSIDYVIQGEGEYPIVALAKTLDRHVKPERKLQLLGLPFNINDLGFPYYEALEIEKYLHKRNYVFNEDCRGIDYFSSRGCSFGCAFCINKLLPQQHHWRGRDPLKVAEDLQYVKERFGVKYVFLEDDLPFVGRSHSLLLAKEIGKLDLTWYGNIRADIASGDFDLLQALVNGGWRETMMGVESGSDRVLSYINKGITVAQVLKAAENLDKLDVYCQYALMTDMPTETVAEKMQTFTLMQKIRKIHVKSEFIGPGPYRHYPGTPWFNKDVESGKICIPSSLREWITTSLNYL